MKKYLELLKNTGLFALSSMAAKLISFFFLPLYTYYLTTEEYAVIDLAHVMQSLLWPVLSLSVAEALLRFGLDRAEDKKKVVSTCINLIVPGLVIFCCIYPFIRLGNALDNYKVETILYFVVLSINSFLGVYARMIDKVKIMVINSTVACFAVAILNVLFLTIMQLGANGYFMALILGNLVSVLSYIFGTKIWNYYSVRFFDRSLAMRILRFSMPLIPNAVFWWVNSSIDKIYLTAMLTLSEVGLYSVAGKIPTLLSTVTSIFQQSWSISAIKEIDSEDNTTFFSNIFKIYSVLMALCTIFLIAASKLLAIFLFSKDFFKAWTITPILIMAFYYSALNIYYGSIFTATKKTGVIFYTTGIGAFVNLFLNYIFITLWGAIGAAIATVVSNFIVWLIRAISTRRVIQLKCPIKNELICQMIMIALIINVETLQSYLLSALGIILVVAVYREPLLNAYTLFAKRKIKN